MSFETIALPAVILVAITAVILLAGRDWRLAVSALGAQYVGVFILVALTWPLEMAVTKLVAGWIAAAVLGMELVSRPENSLGDERFGRSGSLFRIFAAGLVGLAVLSFAPDMAKWMLTASYEQILGGLLLIGMGMLHLGMTAHPLRTILGLLTVLSGFEILYATVETSALVAGFLAAINLGIALIGAYLLAAPILEVEE
ncbi:MAG: hypothetical protein KKD28_14680 [Chloroflexi bacterium]|nr:hypothetical protein [Chloroflexota bacterium]